MEFKSILIIFIVSVLCALAIGIVCFACMLSKAKRFTKPSAVVFYIVMAVSVITVLASWVLNMGWFRVFLTWLAVPFVHMTIFVIINIIVLPELSYSKKLKIYTLISYFSCLLMYFMFPDGGDTGTMYVFFGLIDNEKIVDVFFSLCGWFLVAHITFTVLQLIEFGKIKKNLADENDI